MIAEANQKLDWMIYRLSQRMDMQMIALKYGPDYISKTMDSIISELSTYEIVGREEAA